MRWILVLLLSLAAGVAAGEEPQPPYLTPDDCPAGTVLPEGIAAECGTVTVLEDRARPDGPRIRLRVVTLWRTDRELRPDPVLYINGGPGLWTGLDAEGLASWARAVKEQDWPGNRRLVLFDQRGVGASQILPTSCGRLNQFLMLEILDHTSRSEERWRASFRERAETCWSRFRQAGYDPGRITTKDIAADVADLRKAFGYAAWDLWGVSFGSRVALTVMRDHPQGIRAAILEGVWPPDANFYDYARNTGEAFDALMEACRTDTICNADYPDLEQRFLSLAERLDTQPLTVTIFGDATARIDGWMLLDMADQMLQSGDKALSLPRLIAELEAGETRQIVDGKLIEVTDFVRNEDRYDQAAYASVACADTLPADVDWVAKARSADLRFGDLVWDPAADGYCTAWPVPRSPAADAAPVASDIPALLISGVFDPRTPPSWAEAAVRRLAHGYSFVFPGQGHGVLDRGQPCAQWIAGRFLDDPSRRPDHGCFARLEPPVFEPLPPG
ncbi:alpha/beta hydrolase [Inquilinus sp. NPDC058860]|uniref:alpha/beta hydrolase n=1 Tax=Inquilinus sp. NPDC058860 TaxID=3346652 RepID=UPI0036BA4512